MKLNISVPQKQRKNLRIVLSEIKNKEILNGYYCSKNCIDCEFKNFDKDSKISTGDLNKKGCKKYNLKIPVFSLRVKLNEIEELQVV